MKRISMIVFLLAFTTWTYAIEEDIVKSHISEVTVYTKGAQIVQKANYSIKSGVSKVIIEGISPTIDRNSLQVNAGGNVVILDAKYTIFYPKPEPVTLEGIPLKIRKEIDLVEDSIEENKFLLQEVQDEIDLYTSTKHILMNNGAIKGSGKVNDSIQLLKQAVDYYLVKVNELNKKLSILNRKKFELQTEQNAMRERMKNLRNYQNNAQLNPKPKGPSHRIVVTLNAKESASGRLHISYLVNKAGWVPLYDLRADAASANINLNYKAQVYQSTGVDWDNVKLNISTNNPYLNKTLPTMHPWYLNFNNYQQRKVSNKTLELKKRELSYQRDDIEEVNAPQAESITLSNNDGYQYNAKSSADFTQVVEHLISAEFKIDLPYSIPSNGEQHMVLIRNIDIPASYRHYSIPKLDPSAYLIAEITNLTDYQLVPAQANIFFDGTYMGETFINPNQMEDTLNFSLGKDPNVMIKRTLAKDDCKDKLVGGMHDRTMVYDFEVKNIKGIPLDIVIIDQIPVTTNTEIEIEALDLSKGKLDEKTGFVEWNFKLKPKESKSFELKYRVKHPKDKILYL
jgi:uncharacterized protein (TIGR02231 family)